MPVSSTRLHDPDLQRARALLMLEMRIHGASYEEIATKFRCHRNTVRAVLDYAKKAQLIVDFEDKILSDLVPAAHTAILAALQEGNAQVALEIFKGVLPGFGAKKAVTAQASKDDEDLASYITQLRSGNGFIDGTLADSSSDLLTLAPAEAADVQELLLPANGIEHSAESTPPSSAGSLAIVDEGAAS